MPLDILLIVVAAGMIGVALMLHLTGQTRAFDIADEDIARREWMRHHPDDQIAEITLAPGGRAALVQTSAGLGLLWSLGADTAAYPLTRPRVDRRPDGLNIDTGDYAARRVRLRLPPEARDAWAARIEGATP